MVASCSVQNLWASGMLRRNDPLTVAREAWLLIVLTAASRGMMVGSSHG